MVGGTEKYLFIHETEPTTKDPEIFGVKIAQRKKAPNGKKKTQQYLTPQKLELIKEEHFEIILLSIFRQNKSCVFQKQK